MKEIERRAQWSREEIECDQASEIARRGESGLQEETTRGEGSKRPQAWLMANDGDYEQMART